MEAERPMHNDERDPQDPTPSDEPRPADEPRTADDADRAAGEEFENASWPSQDSVAAARDADAHVAPPSEVEALVPTGIGPEGGGTMPAHMVPATEPGESTQCPRCGTENRPGIAFCQNCGQRLVAAGIATNVARPAAPEGTQACPRCGTHNRAGVAFCQNCGANLRATGPGYVPPAVGAEPTPASAEHPPRGGALLGPIVLLVGAVGIVTAWLLPFPYASGGSLFDRAFGASGGYGIGFWNGYQQVDGLAAQTYFGFAAPAPLLVLLLIVLAGAGFLRARPGAVQVGGLAVALAWSIGLAALFIIDELIGGPGGGLIEIMRALTPAGIIFLLASLIVIIGALTRFGRS
jgi:Double zinc ribbon